jgi:tetratricopeptide (TPR) repeat protein
VDARVMANIDELMKGEKKPYYFAAIYYYNHDKDMNKALSWINEADKNSPDAYNIKYWKARIQLKMGDKAGAIESANRGLKLAAAEPNAEYIRLNKEVLAEAKK